MSQVNRSKVHCRFPEFKDVCYNLSDKGGNLVQPHFNTKWMHKSLSFIASKLWNKLPLYIRNSDNLYVIKKALQKLNLESFY